MDVIDAANDRADAERDALVRGRVVYQGMSADACEDCGLLIPSARQIAVPGCTRCVECAGKMEAGGVGAR